MMYVRTLFNAGLKLLIGDSLRKCQRQSFRTMSSVSRNVQISPALASMPESYDYIDCKDPETYKVMTNDMLVYKDFISEEEEQSLFAEIEPYIKRLRYEIDHWDNVGLLPDNVLFMCISIGICNVFCATFTGNSRLPRDGKKTVEQRKLPSSRSCEGVSISPWSSSNSICTRTGPQGRWGDKGSCRQYKGKLLFLKDLLQGYAL